MVASMAHVIANWMWLGAESAVSMLWLIWWPLVVGFAVAGVIQAFVPRDGLRQRMG
jgi:uncharacterized membrane protein YraQ (UPF0718 family)